MLDLCALDLVVQNPVPQTNWDWKQSMLVLCALGPVSIKPPRQLEIKTEWGMLPCKSRKNNKYSPASRNINTETIYRYNLYITQKPYIDIICI